MSKIIISCAVIGAIHPPAMSSHLPLAPEAIAVASIVAAEAGDAEIEGRFRGFEVGGVEVGGVAVRGGAVPRGTAPCRVRGYGVAT